MKRVEYLASRWHGDDKRMEEYRPSWFQKPVMVATKLMVEDETISKLRIQLGVRENEINQLRAKLERTGLDKFAFGWKKHPSFVVVAVGLFLIVLALVQAARYASRRQRRRQMEMKVPTAKSQPAGQQAEKAGGLAGSGRPAI